MHGPVELKTETRKYLCPDTIHYVEVTTVGMQVTCRVIEDRGRFAITREIFWVEKTKHRWYDYVAKFRDLAITKYSVPIVERLNNSHSAGSL